MKKIKLTKGKYAMVDDSDFEDLSQFKWHCSTQNYAVRNINNTKTGEQTTVRMHRIITNAPKNLQVDHINHERLDNRKSNLRLCTNQENSFNNSKAIGVVWFEKNKKWRAQITYAGKNIFLGYFSDEQEALKIRHKAEKKYFGEFAVKRSIFISS